MTHLPKQFTIFFIVFYLEAVQAWIRFDRAGKTIHRTNWFSEEGSGYSGRQTAPIAGVACDGRYCDEKRLVVVREGSTNAVLDSAHWTHWFSEENPTSADCPGDMIVNEMQCKERFCDEIRLQCGRLATGYRVESSDIKNVDWFSDEQGERLCPDGYYVWGMACSGRYCDNIKLKCSRVDYEPPSDPWKFLTRAGHSIVRSRVFSEEDFGYSGSMPGPISGIKCSGRYCDNKELISVKRGVGCSIQMNRHYTHWFSSGNPTWADCPVDMVVAGIQCRMSYCGEMRLRCGKMASGYRVNAGDIMNVDWFSEEEGERNCPDGYYLWGMACKEDNCDNIKLNCARVEYDSRESLSELSCDDYLADKFAPIMEFDGQATQFPLSSADYWGQSTTNSENERILQSPVSFESPFDVSSMGASYTIWRCSDSIKITYWTLYKGQQPCFSIFGSHEGDWEHVVVELTSDKNGIEAVQFGQHGGWYQRKSDGMDIVAGTHVKSYVGKNSNGQYHDDGGTGGCLYFEDFRNVGSSGHVWKTWIDGSLIPTNTNDEWNAFGGDWGRDGVPGPKEQNNWHGTVCQRNHCNGDAEVVDLIVTELHLDQGCSKSQE